MNEYVKIPMYAYIEALNARRKEIAPRGGKWDVPDCLWEYFINLIEECGAPENPEHANPSYIVDDFAVNGDWGDFDDYKEDGETDEEFIDRMEDNCIAIFPEDRIIYVK